MLDAIELEGLITPARLAHKWGRSAQAGRNWLDAYGLRDEVAVSEALEKRSRERSQPQPEVVVGELVDEGSEQLPPALPGPSLAPVDQAGQDDSSFERLSARQQKAALALATLDGRTYEQIATAAGVTPETLIDWRQDPRFQEAVLELAAPAFRFEAVMTTYKTLLSLVKNGKPRSEDRRLLAELSGLIGTQGSVSVNFNKVEWNPNG